MEACWSTASEARFLCKADIGQRKLTDRNGSTAVSGQFKHAGQFGAERWSKMTRDLMESKLLPRQFPN